MKTAGQYARSEGLLIAIVTVVGAVLRVWALGRINLTHFDEGIYALSGAWIFSSRGFAALDPGLIPYAPPGLPFLIGIAYAVFGLADTSAILIPVLCGIATIPVAGCVARRAWGTGGGVVAAAFAAFSLFHIAFSRKALTDAPFLLTWLTALIAGARFLESPGFRRAVVMGVSVGLAQHFKYNGWLAGVVVFATAMLDVARSAESRRSRSLRLTFGWGACAALIALILYTPWIQFVEHHGGYAALVRHHRNYLGSFGTWIAYCDVQLRQESALGGGPVFPLLAWSVAWWGSAALNQECAKRRFLSANVVATYFLGAALFLVLPNFTWWASLIVFPSAMWSGNAQARSIAVGWLLLSMMTPLYHPYARLWLPLHALGWILISGSVMRLQRAATRQESGIIALRDFLTDPRTVAPVGAAILAAAIYTAAVRPHSFPTGWVLAPEASLRSIAFAFIKDHPPADGTTALVLARRPLVFYLELARCPVGLESGIDSLRRRPRRDELALVDSAILRQDGDVADALRRLETRWEIRQRFDDTLDPVTLLDVNPAAASSAHPRRAESIWVLAPR